MVRNKKIKKSGSNFSSPKARRPSLAKKVQILSSELDSDDSPLETDLDSTDIEDADIILINGDIDENNNKNGPTDADYLLTPSKEGLSTPALNLGSKTPSSLDADLIDAEEIEDSPSTVKTGALSVQDPLRRYIEEIKHYPLLTPEEELSLANKLRDNGDLSAAKQLVQANLRLVVKIAMEYRSLYTSVLDLIQEGNIGLMKAVSKFDPSKGAKLSYYSSWWIRSYILKYLLDNFRLVKLGTTQAQKKLFYQLMREKERLESQGLIAAPKLLAEKLEVREKDVVEMQHRLSGAGAEYSLDAPLKNTDDGREQTAMSSLPSADESVDDILARQELLSVLSKKLPAFKKLLKDKELKILEQRLLAEEPKTLQEVADLYGLTRERARQIETKVIEKLKVFLRDTFETDTDS